MQCYKKDNYWAACQLDCTPGYDPRDPWSERGTPWSCQKLGSRTKGEPLTTTTTLPPWAQLETSSTKTVASTEGTTSLAHEVATEAKKGSSAGGQEGGNRDDERHRSAHG